MFNFKIYCKNEIKKLYFKNNNAKRRKKNFEDKHKKNAKYGWYRCDIHFSIPKCDDKKNVIGRNFYRGRMIIRCDADGKKYLYDIIDIKKET